MKKIAALVLALVMLYAGAVAETYDAEILFRNLPWLMDVDSFTAQIAAELSETLSKDAEMLGIKAVRILNSFVPYFENNARHEKTALPMSGFNFSIGLFKDGALVAGYPISHISGFALYGVENGVVTKDAKGSRVISATYAIMRTETTDFEATFVDLKTKLSVLYGDPVDSWANGKSTSQTDCVRWLGQNDTYVMLSYWHDVSQPLSGMISIEYGTFRAADLVAAIQNPETTIDKSSTDGL